MNQEFSNIELFEAYEAEKLTAAARQDFEKRLSTDETFKEEYELYTTLMGGIILEGDELLKQKMKHVQTDLEKDNFFQEKPQPKIIPMKNNFSIGKIISIAASLALLIGIGWYTLMPNQSILSPREALAKFDHSAKDKAFLSTQLNDLESLGMADPERGKKDTLAQVLKLYAAGEYQTAYNLATNYLNAYPDDASAMYYAGMAKFQDSDYALATEWLQGAMQDKGTIIFDRARWYLALSYTMLETTQGNLNALKLFDQIKEDGESLYKMEAEWHKDMLSNK